MCLLSRIDGEVDVVVVVDSDEREVARGRGRRRDGAVPARDGEAARLDLLDQVRAACLVYDPLWLGLRTYSRADENPSHLRLFEWKFEGGPIAGIGKMAAAAHVGCVSPEVGVDVARCGMICAPRDASVVELG